MVISSAGWHHHYVCSVAVNNSAAHPGVITSPASCEIICSGGRIRDNKKKLESPNIRKPLHRTVWEAISANCLVKTSVNQNSYWRQENLKRLFPSSLNRWGLPRRLTSDCCETQITQHEYKIIRNKLGGLRGANKLTTFRILFTLSNHCLLLGTHI